MKLQASELPLGKPQARRKTPKIAPLLVAFTVLFTIIPLYYPSFRYAFNPKKITEAEKSSSFDSLEESTATATTATVFSHSDPDPLPVLDQNNDPDPDPVPVVGQTNDNNDRESPKEEEGITTGVEEKVTETEEEITTVVEEKATETDRAEDMETEATKRPEMDPARLPSSAKSGMAIAEAIDKNSDHQTATSDNNNNNINGRSQEQQRAAGTRKRSGRREKKRPNRRREKARRIPNLGGDRTNNVNGADSKMIEKEEGCDLFSGEWVPNPEGPYYTNTTCWAIQEHQNCMKFGRPDAEFLKWRWKPDGCELPIFEPNQFLELVRGKSIAFVGDSVARNHMQSLICLLSKVVYPVDLADPLDQNKRWVYRDHNFNISMFWAPYLVRSEKTDPSDVTKPFNLYLDEFDEDWTNNVGSYDYIIISAGHWFFRPTMFYVGRRLVGCQYCPQENVNHLNAYFSYRRAFRTAFRAINSLDNLKGVTFLRTFAPSHFEDGPWDKGGDCVRTQPFKKGERVLDDYNLEMYTIQLQELRIAQNEGKKKGYRFKLFDATQSMLLRPDGHPSKFGHWQNQTVSMAKDCVHWCLPGPIDSWNDFLLELLKREEADRSLIM